MAISSSSSMEVEPQWDLLYFEPKKDLGVNNDRQIDVSIVEKLPLKLCMPLSTRGVSHCGLAICIKKQYERQKKKNYGNSNISPCKKFLSSKKLLQKKPKSFKVLELYYN
jgi:hypothetical protein